jgi:hypothetical protein
MTLFAAMRESVHGTKRTSGTGLTMSVLEGKADLPVAYPNFSLWHLSDLLGRSDDFR